MPLRYNRCQSSTFSPEVRSIDWERIWVGYWEDSSNSKLLWQRSLVRGGTRWPQFLMKFCAKRPSKPLLQNLPGTGRCFCNCIFFAGFWGIFANFLIQCFIFFSDLMCLKGFSFCWGRFSWNHARALRKGIQHYTKGCGPFFGWLQFQIQQPSVRFSKSIRQSGILS